MKVKVEFDLDDEQRRKIGGFLKTWKAAPEEGCRFWIREQISRLLKGENPLEDQLREVLSTLEELYDEVRDKEDDAYVNWVLAEEIDNAIGCVERAIRDA